MQDAGDGPGAVHGRGGDLPDDGVDVVPGELGSTELEHWVVFPLVPPGFVFGEPGFDLLSSMCGYSDCLTAADRVAGGPVPPVQSWAWRSASVADVRVVAVHDGLDHRFQGGLLVGRPPVASFSR